MIPFLAIMLSDRDWVTAVDVTATAERAAGDASRGSAAASCSAVLTVVLAEDAYVTWWTFRLVSGTPVTYYDAAGCRTTSARLLFYDNRAAALDEALEQVRQRARDPPTRDGHHDAHWAYVRTGIKAILPPMEADHEGARRLLGCSGR